MRAVCWWRVEDLGGGALEAQSQFALRKSSLWWCRVVTMVTCVIAGAGSGTDEGEVISPLSAHTHTHTHTHTHISLSLFCGLKSRSLDSRWRLVHTTWTYSLHLLTSPTCQSNPFCSSLMENVWMHTLLYITIIKTGILLALK